MNKQEVIDAIKDCAEKLGRAPTARELNDMTGGRMPRGKVAKRFGNYENALRACGMTRQDKAKPWSMRDTFTNWATVTRRLKHAPSVSEFRFLSSISDKCLFRRFQKWSLVPAAMLRYLEQEKLEGEWSDVAEIVRQHVSSAPLRVFSWETKEQPGRPEEQTTTPTAQRNGLVATGKRAPLMPDKPIYGRPIGHAAMSHAPTNEMGVMVLFGALARELGFTITRLQAAFPDCEAMRWIETGRCQRVLIEFEFESRNFQLHMHDAKGCDLIVCWVHNWKECPVEVIELSNYIGRSGDPVIG